jgi:HEAT repeat protein
VLDASAVIAYLFRLEANAVIRIRALSPDCEIDAGGIPVHWIADVQPAESVALLATFVPADGALRAIALHAGPAADAALARFVAPDQPESLRQRTVSWFGSARGRKSGPKTVAVIREVVEKDPDAQVRRRAVSALHALPDGEGTPPLIEVAKTTQNAEVRKQAMSCLARSRDPRAGPPMNQSTRTRACEARALTTNFLSAVTSGAPSRSASAR